MNDEIAAHFDARICGIEFDVAGLIMTVDSLIRRIDALERGIVVEPTYSPPSGPRDNIHMQKTCPDGGR